jgi:hypothetical protein
MHTEQIDNICDKVITSSCDYVVNVCKMSKEMYMPDKNTD